MKRYHWVRLYALLLMILLFAASLITGMMGTRIILKEAVRQRNVVRGVKTLSDAESIIIRKLSDIAQAAGREQYDRVLGLSDARSSSLTEKDLEKIFRRAYIDGIKAVVGNDGGKICETLNSFLSGYAGVVMVEEDPAPVFYERRDAGGNITAMGIGNVTVLYEDPIIGARSDTLNFDIQFPEAVFRAGSDELFGYCMVARKGIYITGRTSSVIGNVYAGSHKAEESREAEIVYGETGTYGGINILSTQLGVRAERIVSGGDINANGSFVLLSPAEEGLECYAQRMNEIEGFSKDANIKLDGKFIPVGMINEEDPAAYTETVELMDTALSGLSGIEIYYDSDNDGGYSEPYRKLMSSTDVEIRHDFTGIIATPGNVIIHNDINIEGIILCGDRIYAMGNNNIVANPAIVSSLIAGEFAGSYGLHASNYIGGMLPAGLKTPEYYCIPSK